MKLLLPETTGTLDLRTPDGATIRVRRHGNRRGPRLLLSHGNGFAADAYFPFWLLLLRDFEVVLYDQRNHGRNPLCGAAGHTLRRMADDMEQVRRGVESEFGKRPTAGVFHSLSTTVGMLHAQAFGMQWDALVLFDPPWVPPAGHPLRELAHGFEVFLHDWALKRQRRFPSPSDLARRLTRAPRMRRWVPGAAGLMARAITRSTADGCCELVCPPELEASIYLQNADAAVWAIVPSVAREVFVIGSDSSAEDAEPPGKVSAVLPREFGLRFASIPDSGHLLQIERPEGAARLVREYLHSRGFKGSRSV